MALAWAETLRARGWYRATTGVWVAGVCAGIAARFNIQPIWPRVALVLIVVYVNNTLTALTVMLYIAAAFILKPNPFPAPLGLTTPAKSTAAPPPAQPPFSNQVTSLTAKFTTLESRLARLEAAITSTDLSLRRNFRDLGA